MPAVLRSDWSRHLERLVSTPALWALIIGLLTALVTFLQTYISLGGS